MSHLILMLPSGLDLMNFIPPYFWTSDCKKSPDNLLWNRYLSVKCPKWHRILPPLRQGPLWWPGVYSTCWAVPSNTFDNFCYLPTVGS